MEGINKVPRFMKEYAAWRKSRIENNIKFAETRPDLISPESVAMDKESIADIDRYVKAYELGRISLEEAMDSISKCW